MITVLEQRIRVALDVSRWSKAPIDVITATSPLICNGADLQVEMAFSYGDLNSDSQLVDLTSWASVTAELKNLSDVDGIPVWSQTVDNADFNTALTLAAWEAGTSQHAVVDVDAETNAVVMATQIKPYWMAIFALTTDTPAKRVPIAGFTVNVIENGIQDFVPVGVTTPTYYTAAQSDARYLMAVDLTAKANLSGATFTGAVLLASGQMTGATGLYATTKAYVDAGNAATAAASVPNTGATSIAGNKTFSGLTTLSGGVTTAGSVTLGSLSGILKATAGVVSGSATTDNLTEGATNLYYTNTRVDARITAASGAASGICPLDGATKIPTIYLPALGATTSVVATQSAMLALSAAKGDFAFRTDTLSAYVLTATPASTLGNWTVWPYPVTSVGGLTGAVTLTTNVVSEGSNLYFTNARAAAAPLTGFSASAGGNVTSSDSVLTALQRLEYRTNVNDGKVDGASRLALAGGTMTGSIVMSSGQISFSGSANQGLVVNSLTTSQRNALSATNGAIIYNATDTQLNMYLNGTWKAVSSAPAWFNDTDFTFGAGTGVNGDYFVVGATGAIYVKRGGSWAAQAGPFVKLAGSTMTGALTFTSGQNPAIDFADNWTVKTGNSATEWWLQYSGTPYWKFKSDGGLLINNGYVDTTSSGVYKLDGNTVISGGATPIFSLAASWQITTDNTSNIDLSINGGSGRVYTNNAFEAASLKSSDFVNAQNEYRVSGTKVLGSQQPAIADFTAAGGWSDSTAYSDFTNLVNLINTLLSYQRNHGIIDT